MLQVEHVEQDEHVVESVEQVEHVEHVEHVVVVDVLVNPASSRICSISHFLTFPSV